MLLVGGRFACTRCLERGCEERCRSCGDVTLDLGGDTGLATLEKAVKEGKLEPAGRKGISGWWSRRGTSSKVEWVVSLLVTLFTVGILANEGRNEPRTAIVSCLIAFPFFLLLYRLVILLLWLVIRLVIVLLALIVSLVLVVAEMVARRDTTRSTYSGWLLDGATRLLDTDRRWTLEMASPQALPHELEARLEGPYQLLAIGGKTGDMIYGDVLATSFDVRTEDDELVHVELDAGFVEDEGFAPLESWPSVLADGSSSVRPGWVLSAPKEQSRTRQLTAGTCVRIAGGIWSEMPSPAGSDGDFRRAPMIRVLRGTSASPLTLTFPSSGPTSLEAAPSATASKRVPSPGETSGKN